jgi:hemerythrin
MMALIEWNEKFSVGNEVIDQEHKYLIWQVRQLYDALGQSIDALTIEMMLDDLQVDICAHFALEELMMQEVDFPEFEAHKQDHESLLDQIRDLIFIFSEDVEIGRELFMNQLSDWFGNHLITFDARLHNQLKN